MKVPPCAYCGDRLVHRADEDGKRLWVIFWPCEGTTASTTVWSVFEPRPKQPGAYVIADGYQCATRRCPGK